MHMIMDYSTNQAGNSDVVQPSVNDSSTSSLSNQKEEDPTQVQYKFGVRVPRTYGEAISLDKEMGTAFGKIESNVHLTKSSPTKPSVTLAREYPQVGNTRKLKSDLYLMLKLMVNEKDA